VIEYKTGYKYQISRDYGVQTSILPDKDICTCFIELRTNGFLIIKSGYAWDGASGPAIDTKSFIRGSLVHDALYELMREGLLNIHWRIPVDRELIKICLEDGMWKLRTVWVYFAVKTFAKRCAENGNRRKTMTAP